MAISQCWLVIYGFRPSISIIHDLYILLVLERAGEDGSVVVSWGASRAHSLSNRPFPQVTRPIPGVTPAGLRYSALGAVHRTLAMRQSASVQRVTSVFGKVKLNRSTVAVALSIKRGPSNVIGHARSTSLCNRTFHYRFI